MDRPAFLGGDPVRPDGPPSWPPPDPAIRAVLERAWSDGSWGRYHGPHGQTLVTRMAADLSVEHVVLCSSGTVAVELALRGLRIGPGDEVVLAAYDFKGNFANALIVGATPVLVDVRGENWNLDPQQLAAAVTPSTKAIIVSHLHGGCVPMRTVMDIAARYTVPVIEDACQMPGAVIDGRPAGTWGHVGVFSFGGSKLLSAGRGGAFITNQADVVQRARLYSHRGNDAYPLSELQAAVLLPQWERLDERNARRRENALRLHALLAPVAGVEPFADPPSDSQPGHYKLGLKYDPAAFDGLPRDAFAAAMRAEGVALDPGFRALHRIHGRRRFRAIGELPCASDADDRVLVLHHPVLLGDEADLEQIITAIEKVRRFAAEIRDAS